MIKNIKRSWSLVCGGVKGTVNPFVGQGESPRYSVSPSSHDRKGPYEKYSPQLQNVGGKEVKRESKDATWNPFNKWSSKNLALAAIVGALNIAMIQMFAPMSWGPMQFRVAEVITTPFIMVAGYPAALSLLVTSIVSGFMSTGMGVAEMMWNLATFVLWGVASVEIAKRLPFNTFGYQALASWIALITGLWVPTMLATMYGVPWLPLVIWITTAEVITMNGIGYLLLLSIRRTGVLNSFIAQNAKPTEG